MTTLVVNVTEEQKREIEDYVNSKNIDMSEFISNLVFEKLEEDLKLDEERILKALEKSKTEEVYDHTEVWERLGI